MLNPILDLFDDFKGLPPRYISTTKSLRRNLYILHTKADKDNDVIILDKRKAWQLYVSKIAFQPLAHGNGIIL